MASKISSFFDNLFYRMAAVRWRKAATKASAADLGTLRSQRHHARQLRVYLNEVNHVADNRLALPRIGSNAFTRPGGTEWSWRPRLWRGSVGKKGSAAVTSNTALGREVKIFHDCKISELTLRQIRNTREEDLAPYGLRLDVFRFDGSFLSLVVDLPPEAYQGLQRRHIVRVSMIIHLEKPLEVFARLNVKHGPNVEQIVQEVPMDQTEAVVEFDLGYSDLNEKRIEGAWLDLIFEGPEMNEVTIRDMTACRYPRAEM